MISEAISEGHKTKSRTVGEQASTVRKGRLPKNHQDYWKGKLRKRSYRTADGSVVEIPEWQVRITHRGREAWFNTHTGNKVDASITARDIYMTLVSPTGGWEAALTRWKPETAKRKSDCTVGEFLKEVESKAGIKPSTFAIYARKFRSLVSDIADVPEDGKHDYATGAYDKWLEKVHAVKLSRLSPERVQKWKVYYVNKAADPMKRERAQVSANSILRSSKSLFSPKVLKHVRKGLELPAELPFDGVEFEKVGKTRYKSEIKPDLLSVAAHNELKVQEPEIFKIFLLGLGCGLRRDEIDTLTWDQLHPEAALVRIESNEWTATKSKKSQRDVYIDPDLMAMLLTFKAGSKSPFVVNSEVRPRHTTTYHHYRCQRHFDKLVTWLRNKGVKARNALHSLRKEFGSLVCQAGGIYQASEQLGHSDIRITRDSYLDRKDRVVVKLAGLKVLSVGEPPVLEPLFRKPGRPEQPYCKKCGYSHDPAKACKKYVPRTAA